ncbi:TonB-dependent siderophore receptor [Sphaerotilus sp.]|uniref:TonB-dependent siderophore receptor n=1 Tax=Sphaerotilus sp. TaxID=2093942 RepID=UPI002ACDB90D|nr:TonB-dependent siderophore receptor [Sphaerotilus sp.]MDZ7855900.1 TonB-dependent siderophore receptor [Sphaerotilus sp.]
MPTFTRTNTPRTSQRHLTHIASAVALLLACQAAIAQTAPAAAPTSVTFNVATQPLDQALARFARQAGLQLAASPDLLRGLQGRAVSGALGVQAALDELLRGSGLRGRIADGLLTIERGSQRAEAETTMPVVRVKADAVRETATGPVAGYVAKRSATGTRTDTPIVETPQSISIITADQIKDQGAGTLTEALRYSAGVRAEAFALNNRDDSFRLRGGSEGSTLLNGLRSSQSHPFNPYLTNEPFGLERIEVLRGPASVIAGQNGPGGAVNLVSKRPQADASRNVELQVGNYDHKQIAVDLTGPLGDDQNLLYRFIALGKDSNYSVDHAKNNRTFVAPSLTWKILSATQLTLYSEYQKDDSGTTISYLPYQGTIQSAPHGRISPSLFTSEPSWDRNGGERTRFGYEFSHEFSPNWKLRHNLRHDRTKGGYLQLYPNWWEGFVDSSGASDPNGTYLNRSQFGFDNKTNVTNADLLLQGNLVWGRTQHTLLLGVDAMRANVSYRTLDGSATPLDVYNPVYGTFPEPSFDGQQTTKGSMRNAGVLVQDQIKIDERYVVVAGLRHDRAKTTDGDQVTDSSAISRNIGLVYLANGGWAPYTSYTESFEPQAGSDKTGTAFKPRRGKQVELGVRWSPNKQVTASAAAYQLKENNRLATDPADPNYSIQRGEVTAKGVELEIAGRFRDWDLTTNYTHTQARVTRTTPDDIAALDKQLVSIPKHSAAAWAVHKFGSFGLPELKAGFGIRYVGKTGDGYDDVTAPSYTLMDAMVAYEPHNWRIALNVSNLTDKTYLGVCNYGYCNYGPRRQAVLTVGYRW